MAQGAMATEVVVVSAVVTEDDTIGVRVKVVEVRAEATIQLQALEILAESKLLSFSLHDSIAYVGMAIDGDEACVNVPQNNRAASSLPGTWDDLRARKQLSAAQSADTRTNNIGTKRVKRNMIIAV